MASAKGETGRQTHRIPSRDEGRDWESDIDKLRNAEERQQAHHEARRDAWKRVPHGRGRNPTLPTS